MISAFKNSRIYSGRVFHHRYSPKTHKFDYSLYMLALDVEEIENAKNGLGVFGFSPFHPLRFLEKDYLKSEPNGLTQRIKQKVQELNGYSEIYRITMLVQVRCFGIYFSPVNFYFCFDESDRCTQMLAEVSNTPWNERHYYLVDLTKEKSVTTKKSFQVSPFMDLNMVYQWKVIPPNDNKNLLVQIENKPLSGADSTTNKLFHAKLVMRSKAFNRKELLKIWLAMPLMTVKVVVSIYWQALKLLVKKVPFIGYLKPE